MDNEFDVQTLTGRFPAITVDMDTQLELGSTATITVAATVRQIRHERTASGVRRVHLFQIESMSLTPADEEVGDFEHLCCECDRIGHESTGRWAGESWVCNDCIRTTAPWVNSNEAVLHPTPQVEQDEDGRTDTCL